jgi:hypothetical protein
LAFRVEKFATITEASAENQNTLYEKDNTNNVCFKVISFTMEKSIRHSTPKSNNAKDYLKYVGDMFTYFEKAKK